MVSHLPFSCSSLNASLEIQISALKEDLEKEHQRWHSAQANYERQVNWRVFVFFCLVQPGVESSGAFWKNGFRPIKTGITDA